MSNRAGFSEEERWRNYLKLNFEVFGLCKYAKSTQTSAGDGNLHEIYQPIWGRYLVRSSTPMVAHIG